MTRNVLSKHACAAFGRQGGCKVSWHGVFLISIAQWQSFPPKKLPVLLGPTTWPSILSMPRLVSRQMWSSLWSHMPAEPRLGLPAVLSDLKRAVVLGSTDRNELDVERTSSTFLIATDSESYPIHGSRLFDGPHLTRRRTTTKRVSCIFPSPV